MSGLPSVVFLDRDGTIIQEREFLSDPAGVELLDGAAESIAGLNAAAVPVVVITNQSGIGRGFYSVEDYAKVKSRLDEALAERGARIDATYFCPHSPDADCDCRKPGALLFSEAARDLNADLRSALLIGDRWRDVAPAVKLGAVGILVPGPHTPQDEIDRARREAAVAPTLSKALNRYQRPA